MKESTALLDALADLLRYPDSGYRDRVSSCRRHLRARAGDAGPAFTGFSAALREKTLDELEELFTRTFDLNPACCLEVGWHLYGENYDRGRLLVRLRQELRVAGLEESGELPDHLSHVLRLLPRTRSDRAGEFARDGVLPALEKMIASLEGRNNPYQGLLRTIQALLQEAVSPVEEVAHV